MAEDSCSVAKLNVLYSLVSLSLLFLEVFVPRDGADWLRQANDWPIWIGAFDSMHTLKALMSLFRQSLTVKSRMIIVCSLKKNYKL